MSSKKNVRHLSITSSILLAFSCLSQISFAEANQDSKASYGGFISIFFKPGFPAKDDVLDSSASIKPELFSKIMNENLSLITALPNERVRVIGSTDDTECIGRECIYLSARRALLIEEWLIAHGVSRSRMDPIMVLGKDYPASENNSMDGRELNRRAEIAFSSEDRD